MAEFMLDIGILMWIILTAALIGAVGVIVLIAFATHPRDRGKR